MKKKKLLKLHHLFKLFTFLCVIPSTFILPQTEFLCGGEVCIRALGGKDWRVAIYEVWPSFIQKINTERLPFTRLCIRSLSVLKVRLVSAFQRVRGEEREGGLSFMKHLLCVGPCAKHFTQFIPHKALANCEARHSYAHLHKRKLRPGR